jgi:glycosyltransferase
MRVLFSTTAGSGHFGPLIPFAKACSNAGHIVKVAAPASFATDVSRAGLDHAPFDDVPSDVMGPVFGRLPEMSFELANATVMGEIFGRLDAQAALPRLGAIIDVWQPDIVVREPCEFASLVAAERAGLPQVQVAIGMGPLDRSILSILATPLAELSVLAELPEDGATRTLMRTPGFTTVPAALDGSGLPDPNGELSASAAGSMWRFHDRALTAGPGALPPPWGDPDHPLVYVTFGSVTAGIGPFSAIYTATLEALADMPVRVLMTTGHGGDPASLAPIPLNTRVEQWWPQANLMPHTAVVVGHGGFGTTMMALAAGVPQVIVPLFAFDQTTNAERVAAIGAGIHLPGGPGAVAAIPSSLTRVLTDPTYRDAAQAVAADMARLPSVTESVPILQNLAAR